MRAAARPPHAEQERHRAPLGQVRVLYSYAAAEDDELTMEAGDVLDVIDSEGDWWMGRIGGVVGNFPSNYVVPFEEGRAI